MATKHILVPTDGSEPASAGVRYAVQVAAHYGATVHGLHVVDVKLLEGPFLRDVSASLGTAPYANYQGNIAMILEERGKSALAYVEKIAKEAGVTCENQQNTGLVARCILDESELADLVIMGRSGENDEWLEGILGSTTQAVVRRSTCPVLVTGRDTPGRDVFTIAYDGSNHAKRALQVAAMIAKDWDAPLRVLSVGGYAETLVEEALAYLKPHGLSVEAVTRSGDPSETIVAYAEECGADLIIMGSYGHTKVRELVVGSTTAYVLNHAPCPVLMTR